jgi:hypothetical protein
MRVQREIRAADDGYSCELVPGLHASADAERLASEIAFSSGRLLDMQTSPPGIFAEIRALAAEGPDGLERATWICFLTVYLSPLPGDDPFAGVRLVLERERELVQGGARAGGDGESARNGDAADVTNGDRDWDSPLDGVPLGPRTSHEPARGSETLRAYRQWALHADRSEIDRTRETLALPKREDTRLRSHPPFGQHPRFGQQAKAIVGDESWTPQRRFERAFERLALPGFGRAGRYELLVTLGRLGLYELQAGSLWLAAGRGLAADDLTTVAAKRLFAVGDPIYLERRALAFAEALAVPVDVLDLAFANWAAGERATVGFDPDILDGQALESARGALGLGLADEDSARAG